MGNALRGMLLNAYAFGTIGTIAIWGAFVTGAGSLLLFVLVGLGFRHSRRVPEAADVRLGHAAPTPALA